MSSTFTLIRSILLILFCVVFFVLWGSLEQTQAAGPATMTVEPAAATHQVGQSFTASIRINGNGSPFIVAEATVAVTPNLEIEDLTFGDCSFTFIKTPTVQNPSFTGGIPGGSSEGCTVYTMTLRPISPGNGAITLSNGAVKSSTDASELLSSYQNATYLLTTSASNNVPPPLQPAVVQSNPESNPGPQTSTQSQPAGGYTVLVSILGENGKAAEGDSIVLYSGESGTVVATAQTDENGQVILAGIEPGTYNIVVARGTEKVAEQIITVSGENPEMKFTLKTTKSLSPTDSNSDSKTTRNILLSLLLLGILIIVGSVGYILWRKKKKNQTLPPSQPITLDPPTNA